MSNKSIVIQLNQSLHKSLKGMLDIANEYIELANGVASTETGKYDSNLDNTVDSVWCDHFGFDEKLNASSTLDAMFG